MESGGCRGTTDGLGKFQTHSAIGGTEAQVSNNNKWRKDLKVGDLVMMRSDHMAILTSVYWRSEDSEYPHVKLRYTDDCSDGSCSAWRVKEVLSESR